MMQCQKNVYTDVEVILKKARMALASPFYRNDETKFRFGSIHVSAHL